MGNNLLQRFLQSGKILEQFCVFFGIGIQTANFLTIEIHERAKRA